MTILGRPNAILTSHWVVSFRRCVLPRSPQQHFFVCVKIIIARNPTTMTFHAKVFSPHRHGIQTHKSSYIAYIHRNGEVKTQHSIVALPLSVAVFYSKMIWKCKFRHRYYKALLLLRWHCLFKFSLIYAIPLAGQLRKVKRKKSNVREKVSPSFVPSRNRSGTRYHPPFVQRLPLFPGRINKRT